MKLTREEDPYFIEFDDQESVHAVRDFLMDAKLDPYMYDPYIGGRQMPAFTLRELIDSFPTREHKFQMASYSPVMGREILARVPMAKPMSLSPMWAALFITPPGGSYIPHKDGEDLKFGINYPLYIRDDGCITEFYTDEELHDLDYFITRDAGTRRQVQGYQPGIHKPIHSFTMRPDRPVLFNTDIYHRFANAKSKHWRVILTLRSFAGMKSNFEMMAKRLRRYAE